MLAACLTNWLGVADWGAKMNTHVEFFIECGNIKGARAIRAYQYASNINDTGQWTTCIEEYVFCIKIQLRCRKMRIESLTQKY